MAPTISWRPLEGAKPTQPALLTAKTGHIFQCRYIPELIRRHLRFNTTFDRHTTLAYNYGALAKPYISDIISGIPVIDVWL